MPRKPSPSRVPGKRGVRESHAPHLRLSTFRAGALPAPPASGDVTMGLTSWGMLGNGPTPANPPSHPTGMGDCGVAGTEHGRMAKALVSVGNGVPTFETGFVLPTTPYTAGLYFAYGNAQGEPGPYPDQGVTNAMWMQYLYDHKLIDWYGELDTRDPAEIHAVMLACRGVLVAVALNKTAEQQFANGQPWSVGKTDPSTPSMGHDILLVGFSPTGETFVSWGAVQHATVTWDSACILDAWAFGTKEDAERAGYTFAAIRAAIESAGGTVNGPAAGQEKEIPMTTAHPAVVSTLTSNEETIATHIASALAAAGGAIALLHPGFHIPTVVEACVVPVSWAIAAGLEIYNLVTKRSLKKAVVGLLHN